MVSGKDDLTSAKASGQIIAETSTLSVNDKLVAKAALAEVGMTLMDCPVSGVAPRARLGELALFASGDQAAYDRLVPVFDAISRAHDYVGEFGHGSMFKYIANLF